ncbi:MAG TPA: response regulator [candidate division Zixibacteria bacterium]|nr:response regulator [candidate division Zixibacteria bacterium]
MTQKRILVVDDDPHIRLLYQTELEECGYRVETMDSAVKLLQAGPPESFDLIVLDIEMPEMTGIEALQELRKKLPDTRVVINSAYSIYKADFQTWLADDYLVKSSDLSELKESIAKLLE